MQFRNLFNGVYAGKKVFVTGHTGFKGSWLVYWLKKMGAEVTGYSLQPQSEPNHFSSLFLDINSIIGDIRDTELLGKTIAEKKPEIVFHLAAQALVRDSYVDPVGTYSTNVIGTMNVLEACRASESVRAIVAITTDKVYQNREWWWGYREVDELGGYDPYSSSKACAEIMIASYRNSFFNLAEYGKSHNILLSSVRAGNVIGGGDWARDRLIPDIMRSCSHKETVVIRSPHATRPWQHVLECLSGYLTVGQHLLLEQRDFATAFNFGPPPEGSLCVEEVVRKVKKYWAAIAYEIQSSEKNPHEARFLSLDCSKAHSMLKWHPTWDLETTFERTVQWYKNFYTINTVSTAEDLALYVEKAAQGGLPWTM